MFNLHADIFLVATYTCKWGLKTFLWAFNYCYSAHHTMTLTPHNLRQQGTYSTTLLWPKFVKLLFYIYTGLK